MSVSTFAICGMFAGLVLMAFWHGCKTYDFFCRKCGEKFCADEVEMYMVEYGKDIFFDACDCPNCGCQLIIGRRLEEIE